MFPSFVIPDAGGAAPGFKIPHSLRFNGSSSRMAASVTLSNVNKWTWNGWVKFGSVSIAQCLIGTSYPTGLARYASLSLNASSQLQFAARTDAGTLVANYFSVETLLDPTAWYNVHLIIDSSQAVAADKVQIWVNGVRLTLTVSTPYAAGMSAPQIIGSRTIDGTASQYFNGEMAQIYRIDDQHLLPTDFGEFDVYGKWVPKAYAGTFTGGSYFYRFNDGTSTATLGSDSSGMTTANNATLTGFTRAVGSSECWMTDSPTNNFCVLDPLYVTGTVAFGALTYTTPASTACNARGTVGMSSGKWWWEHAGANANSVIGICNDKLGANVAVGASVNAWCYYGLTGNKTNGAGGIAYGASFTSTDTVGVLFDADAGTLEFFKQTGNVGVFVSQGIAFTGIPAGVHFPMCSTNSATATTMYENFGQRDFRATSAGWSRPWNSTSGSGVPDSAKSLTAENTYASPMVLSGNSYYSGTGPVLWMNGVPDTITFNSVVLTYPADFTRLAVGAKILKTHAAGNYNWTATVLNATNSKFYHQNAHVK